MGLLFLPVCLIGGLMGDLVCSPSVCLLVSWLVGGGRGGGWVGLLAWLLCWLAGLHKA